MAAILVISLLQCGKAYADGSSQERVEQRAPGYTVTYTYSPDGDVIEYHDFDQPITMAVDGGASGTIAVIVTRYVVYFNEDGSTRTVYYNGKDVVGIHEKDKDGNTISYKPVSASSNPDLPMPLLSLMAGSLAGALSMVRPRKAQEPAAH